MNPFGNSEPFWQSEPCWRRKGLNNCACVCEIVMPPGSSVSRSYLVVLVMVASRYPCCAEFVHAMQRVCLQMNSPWCTATVHTPSTLRHTRCLHMTFAATVHNAPCDIHRRLHITFTATVHNSPYAIDVVTESTVRMQFLAPQTRPRRSQRSRPLPRSKRTPSCASK